ncbi:hypothetical protein [Hoeflea sp. BAL378]|uniref:DUF1127 domain-containing protein n=1 Tax=Hoeflea sp. BAL378 TaxID=1547437 RepID=UPI0005579BB3|nr:hypothetical protein [Hoeflea sp. BAL378]
MPAQPYPPDRGLERESRPFTYRGKDYLRFEAIPPTSRGPDSRALPPMPALYSAVSRPAAVAATPPGGVLATLRLWRARIAERRRMMDEVEGFTDEMLRDLGLTRRQARAVARTPFWRGFERA